MQIDKSIYDYCARKTRELSDDYEKHCLRQVDGRFPRNVNHLHWLIMDRMGAWIHIYDLDVSFKDVRAIYFRSDGDVPRVEIYILKGQTPAYMDYAQAKELLQTYLDVQSLRTTDIVDLVTNMIARSQPSSHDLNLGHASSSETMAEVAAMEFLFPYAEREKLRANGVVLEIEQIAKTYGIPPHLAAWYLTDEMMDSLRDFGNPDMTA